MLVYEIKQGNLVAKVSLDTKDGDEFVTPRFSGDPYLIEVIKSKINNGYGAFGHITNTESISPYDLDAVLKKADLNPVIIQGAGIVAVYKTNIPKGALT